MPDLVLRLPRTDVVDDFVLVNIQHSGSSPLDLKLVATDSEYPFVTQIRQKAISNLQASNSSTSLHDWQAILSFVLLQSAPDDPVLAGVEAVAHVTPNSSQLVIAIRKKISGITQRLGAITLDRNDEESVQLFDWGGLAVSRADALADQLAQLQTSVADQQSQIKDLTAQLDDLVKAKKAHQDELLKKFAALLNTKKLKIRDQQRLLAHAKVDPKAATQVEHARSAASRRPDRSRPGKRKANEKLYESETDDDDFEGTDLGNRNDEEDDIRQEVGESMTPDRSDQDTTEDEESDGFGPTPVQSQVSRPDVGSKGRALENIKPKQTMAAPRESEMQQPPPRRQLPFAKKDDQGSQSASQAKARPAAAPAKPLPSPMDDDETDDEL